MTSETESKVKPAEVVRTAEVVRDPQTTTALMRMDPQALIRTAIERDASIETIERLVALAKDVRAEQARSAWYEAMAEFQRDCPPITKTKRAKIYSSKGSYEYSYAPLDEILRTASPVMGRLGLSVSWTLGLVPSAITANCRISHTLGHFEESGPLTIPLPTEGGANGAQRVGISTTYAKRYSLLAALGMSPQDDPDAHGTGGGGEQGGGNGGNDGSAGVQQPRRASESTERQAAHPGEWRGALASREVKTGKKKDGKSDWTMFVFVGADGTKLATFDTKVGDAMAAFVGTGEEVVVQFEEGQHGKRAVGVSIGAEQDLGF